MQKEDFTIQTDFQDLKSRSEESYRLIKEIYCPHFKESVYFNSQGLEHLSFKKRDKMRLEQDQYMRFKLLHLAPLILKSSSTLQGVWTTKRFEYLKINKRWQHILKDVTYYEFISVVDRNRVKVIIKQIEGGKKVFWSLIPFWRMNKNTNTRILHEGDPEED